MVWLLGGLAGLAALYLWLLGHWFGAVLAMPAFGLIGFFVQQLQVSPANPATPFGAFMVLLVCPLLAWVPFVVRRQIRKARAGESLSLSLR